MSNLIDEAIIVLRALPDDAQDAATRAIIAYGAEVASDFRTCDG